MSEQIQDVQKLHGVLKKLENIMKEQFRKGETLESAAICIDKEIQKATTGKLALNEMECEQIEVIYSRAKVSNNQLIFNISLCDIHKEEELPSNIIELKLFSYEFAWREVEHTLWGKINLTEDELNELAAHMIGQ